MAENINYVFTDTWINGHPQHDNNWWEPAGHYLTILLNDKEEHALVKNYIITDRLITEHVMNCSTCLERGLSRCIELIKLKGVYS